MDESQAMTMEPEAAKLTQRGPHGITFDFNDGCRIIVPQAAENWRVQISDLDAACVVFDQSFSHGMVQTSKRYFIRFGFKIWRGDEIVLSHDLNLRDKPVLIRMHLGGVGDHLAWMGHVAAFARIHQPRLTCLVRSDLKPLLQPAYPEITFVTPDDVMATSFYATYSVLIFFNDQERHYQPLDYRQVGLNKIAAYILGLEPIERRPDITIAPGERPFPEKYVCIATHGSSFTKLWHNPRGWIDLIRFLKEAGYRVLCIDQCDRISKASIWRGVPYGAEDFTGSLPLDARVQLLHHAAFFIGLSSGLSWLAWAVGTPVVMISGFTEVLNEFSTPYRIINRHVCHGCANDDRIELDRTDYFWCPRLKNTSREFECSRFITVEQVTSMLERIPGFREVI